MATFSVNQVRQLYVVNSLKTPSVLETDSVGSVAVKNDDSKQNMFLQYKGADNLMRSDLISVDNILSVVATDADSMAHPLKAIKVALDPEVNGGIPIAGQDYILRIVFKQYVGMSDEDQYFKYGLTHAYAGMSINNFYETMAMSLAKNFCRELVPLVNVYINKHNTTDGELTNDDEWVPALINNRIQKIPALAPGYEFNAVIIEEVPQEWTLGIKAQVPVYFYAQPTSIVVEGDNRIWGTVTELKTGKVIENGHKIADLEYFFMGERGDVYRQINWPHSIPTKYLVDPDKKYNVIDIHYAYVGSNEGVQKSEKTITLVIPKVGVTNSVSNKLTNDILQAISSTGKVSVKYLDASAS